MVVMIQLKAETAIAMQTEIQQLREKSQVFFYYCYVPLCLSM
jgi:hypothetical protein